MTRVRRGKRRRHTRREDENAEHPQTELTTEQTASNADVLEQIPNEILIEIFLHCLPPLNEHPEPSIHTAPLLLGRVCRRWRGVSTNTPRLWKYLHLTNYSMKEGRVIPINIEHQETLALMWMSRSARVGLTLRIVHLYDREGDDPNDLVEALRMDSLSLCIYFCTTLELLITDPPFLERMLIAAEVSSSLRSLLVSTADLSWHTGATTRPTLTRRPLSINHALLSKLHSLSSIEMHLSDAVKVDTPTSESMCENLKKVALEQHLHWSMLVEWLAFCPNLEEARFSIVDGVPVPETPQGGDNSRLARSPRAVTVASAIRKLSLVIRTCYDTVLELMVPLSLPNLSHLTIELKNGLIVWGFSSRMTLPHLANLILKDSLNLVELNLHNLQYTRAIEVVEFLAIEQVRRVKVLNIDGSNQLEEFEHILRGLTVPFPSKSGSTLPTPSVPCPQLECLEISYCCWRGSTPFLLGSLIGSRYGVRSVFRCKGKGRGKFKAKDYDLDLDLVRRLKRVVISERKDGCYECEGPGKTRNWERVVAHMRKNEIVKRVAEKGLEVLFKKAPEVPAG